MSAISQTIKVKNSSTGVVKEITLYDTRGEVSPERKELAYNGKSCWMETTTDASSSEYARKYSGWSYKDESGATRHALVSNEVLFAVVATPADAIVTINGSVTDSVLIGYEERVQWSVSRTGYVTQSGDQEVTKDTTVNVDLTPMLVSVTVNPTPSDATVTILVDGLQNEPQTGSVTRYCNAGSLVEWTVEKDGYKTQTGSFTIYEDTVIDVELIEATFQVGFDVQSQPVATMIGNVTINGEVKTIDASDWRYGYYWTYPAETEIYMTVELSTAYGYGYRKTYYTPSLTGNMVADAYTTSSFSTLHGTLNGAAVVYRDSATSSFVTCSADKWLEESAYPVNAGRFTLCGVLVGDGSDEMVVATTEKSGVTWGSTGDTGGTLTTSQDTARADMNGKDNSWKGEDSGLCRGSSNAIGWIIEEYFSWTPTGSDWWLPSDGECVLVNKSLSALNSILSSIGTKITTSSIRSMTPYWTSTQYSAESSWSYYFDLGSELGDTDRANRAIARPVSRLSTGVGCYTAIDE